MLSAYLQNYIFKLEEIQTGWSYRCLMRGMLMQLAAATAAKGTNLPTRGDMCWTTTTKVGVKQIDCIDQFHPCLRQLLAKAYCSKAESFLCMS